NFRAVGSGFQPMGILGRVTEGLYMFTVRAAETRRGLCSGRWARLDEVVDIRLNDARAWNPKSRQGRPKVDNGFNRWLRVEIGQRRGGAKEKMGLGGCVLSSLTGLVLNSRRHPAMNRWAIFERPCGTWNHGTLNRYQGF